MKTTGYSPVAESVYIMGKGKEKSVCTGTCTYLYAAPTTNVAITGAKATYAAGETITVTGTGFTPGSNDPIVTLGGTTITPSSAVTDTSIVFSFPALEDGKYPLLIEIEGLGYASPIIEMTTTLTVDTIQPATGSYVANTIKLIGNGLKGIGSKDV